MISSQFVGAQSLSLILRDIKSFGAKGDGKTNDHDAFARAAEFFNKRGGFGRLFISSGKYLVGRQIITDGQAGKMAWEGQDVLEFNNLTNFSITGTPTSHIKYISGMRFGSFEPKSGKIKKVNGFFADPSYAAMVGHCIKFTNCKNIQVSQLDLNGNNSGLFLGGNYGDVGWQLHHYGILIRDCINVNIHRVNVHHFGLDGIYIANRSSKAPDNIEITNSKFDYNSRQGLTWAGGNDLNVRNCQFNHTGKGIFASPPSAGIDIEAEYGPVRNGAFENCSVLDANGCCLVAESGDIRNVSFDNCTFWSSTTWSIWVKKPQFTFNGCNIFGPVVHGYDSPNNIDATKFLNCYFEDKPYRGKLPMENYLFESNHARRVRFENCQFYANTKKLFWMASPASYKPEEKYQLINCTFTSKSSGFSRGDFIAVMRGVFQKNTTFKFNNVAKEKGYFIADCCENYNVDGGGNKIIYE